MKKLFVLVSALLLVGMIAAAEVTVSGKVEIRGSNDLTDEVYTPAGVVELKFDAMVDDNNSAYIEIEEGNSGLPPYAAPFDRAHFTSDIGAALGLPVGVTIRGGFDEFKGSDAMGVTKGDYEDFYGDAFTTWGYRIEVMASEFATLRFAQGGDWDTEELLIGVYGTYDPVTYEVFYVIDTDLEPGDGQLEAGAEYHGDVADGIAVGASAAVAYDVLAEMWGVGIGVDVLYNDMVRAGIGFRSEKDAEAGAMQVDLSATPPAPVDMEVFLALGFALDEAYGAETFDSADFGVMLDVGAVFYVGYLYSNVGGKIAKEWAEIDPTGEEGAVYIRGKLEF